MVDSAVIYFIQHFADIYFSKSICISACGGYQVSRTYCQVSLKSVLPKKKLGWTSGFYARDDSPRAHSDETEFILFSYPCKTEF